jgi:carbamoyltransferase
LTVILGLNAYHGDASACIVRDGEVLVAIEEERLTRVKHTGGFPVQAIRACLALSGIHPEEIDHVVIPRKRSAHILSKALWAVRLPHLAFKRGRVWRKFGAIEDMLAHSLDIPRTQMKAQFHFVEHHVAHAASSFYASPFEDAAILSLDGLGDFASTLWGSGKDLDMNIDGFVLFPHSLGIYYTAITQYLGFWKYGDEYKVMGLASY